MPMRQMCSYWIKLIFLLFLYLLDQFVAPFKFYFLFAPAEQNKLCFFLGLAFQKPWVARPDEISDAVQHAWVNRIGHRSLWIWPFQRRNLRLSPNNKK